MSDHRRITLTRLRRAVGRLPRRLLARIEDRAFGAVHHMTRVTNDAYPQPEDYRPAAKTSESD